MEKDIIIFFRKNIKVLDVKLDAAPFLGEKIILKIYDENNKYFKKKTIKASFIEINNLNIAIEETILNYIYDTKRYRILYLKQKELIKEWKEKNKNN